MTCSDLHFSLCFPATRLWFFELWDCIILIFTCTTASSSCMQALNASGAQLTLIEHGKGCQWRDNALGCERRSRSMDTRISEQRDALESPVVSPQPGGREMKGHARFSLKKWFSLYYFSMRERVLYYRRAGILIGRIVSRSQSQLRDSLSIILMLGGERGWAVQVLSLLPSSSALSFRVWSATRVPHSLTSLLLFWGPLPPPSPCPPGRSVDYGGSFGSVTSVGLTFLIFGDGCSATIVNASTHC